MEKSKISKEQESLNNRLATLLKNNKIKNLCITSYGNSIAAGYSMMRTICPFLMRNDSIESSMKVQGISLERHSFARAQNNNDEHLFEWLVSNVKESEINRMSRNDYHNSITGLPIAYSDASILDIFYPLHLEEDRGLRDIIESKGIDLANIVVYNGCTGSFIDTITRGGKPTNILGGITRDIKSLESILKYIQSSNRKNNTSTQVYICGVPDFLGIGISNTINSRLKRVSKKFANTCYVEPVKSKFFYRNKLTSKWGVDIHYDEDEYDELNNNVLRSILDNYEITGAMIDSDRRLYQLSSTIELEDSELFYQDALITDLLDDILKKEVQSFSQTNHIKSFYKRLCDYLLARAPYDYYYVGKKNMRTAIQKKLKQPSHS